MKATAVDLFTGVGGLTRGLEAAGIPVAAGIDIEERCAYPYEANTDSEFIHWDLTHLTHGDCGEDCFDQEDVANLYPENESRILVGCAPCSPFSTMGEQSGESHDKYELLRAFESLIDVVDPAILVTENVPRVVDSDVYEGFRETVEDQYGEDNVWSDTVDCLQYGIPQTRSRLLLMASEYGEIQLVPPTHPDDPVTVRETLQTADLPPIEAGGGPPPEDPLHYSAGLSPKNIERMKQSIPGGTWKDWDEELRAECHTRSSGQKYLSSYGRMEWDEPAPTITTNFYNYGSGRFGHPDYDYENPEQSQNRALSLREGALLQTFPKGYEFVNPDDEISTVLLGKLIGNAVPVRLGKVIGGSIQHHLQSVGIGRIQSQEGKLEDTPSSGETWSPSTQIQKLPMPL